jgi:parallel beta-helix repeat protein
MKGLSGFEQVGGVVRDNVVAFCSDDGIYVNRSARSVIDHNTLLDTAGIDVRFIESSATVTANIVDGAIRKRDGASLQSWDNAMPFLPGLFVGLHPQRGLFRDPAALDLAWRREPPSVTEAEPRADLCGRQRGTTSPPGAFEDYAGCLGGQ